MDCLSIKQSNMNLTFQLSNQRKANGMSQEQLAHVIGVDRTTLQRWENNSKTPSLYNFCCWVESLGLQIEIKEKNKITENNL
jgi:DNA-binding XRE family transcriptional regulator